MQRIQRYLFKESLGVFAGLLLLIVCILLLERLLRIADFVSRSPGKISEAGEMLVNLVPHYAGIGIPAAVFLAILITVSRISRSGELVATWGAGKSLLMISKPFMLLAVIMAAVLLVVSAYFQPVSRYQYRSLVNSITTSSVETVFSEGKFVEAEDWTVWTENVDRTTGAMTSSFILERRTDGSRRIIVSETGNLRRADGAIVELQLDAGMGADLKSDSSFGSRVEFDSLKWRPPDSLTRFRARGKDVRELTLWELFQNEIGSETFESDKIPRLEASASLHDQLARFVLVLILPLIAIPFGLSYGRNPPSNAILIGIVTLIAVQQLLEFGKSMALSGDIPVWLGSWSVIVLVMLFAGGLYYRSVFTMAQPPLSSLPSFNLKGLLRPSSKPETPAP